MTAMERTARKASLEVRQELLRYLGVPLGSVVIARRPSPEGDVLVVRTAAANTIKSNRRPQEFQGFTVAYEIVQPLKVGT